MKNRTLLKSFGALALCLCVGVPDVARSATDYGGIAYGNGGFVALFADGSGTARTLTSPNGQSWTDSIAVFDIGQVFRISSFSFANDRFLAGHGWGQASRSSNGANWTYLTWVGNQQVFDFEYGNGVYVAVWELFSGQDVSTSTDGLSWTLRSSGIAQNLYSLAYGSGTFVAVGDAGVIATTLNGVTWTVRTSGTTQTLNATAYGAGIFVAVGSGGTILTSTNGVNWISLNSGTGQNLLAVAHGSGVFAAVGEAGTILTSGNGSSWASQISGTSAALAHIAYGDETFVAMGYGPVFLSSIDWLNSTPLDVALDSTNLVWTTGGNAAWTGRTNVTHDGIDAARSEIISDNEESWLQTTVTGPGTLAFWWKVSSEMDYDVLEFSIDGVVQRTISGDEVWQQLSFAIAAGNHTMRWSYAKDDSTAKGQDRAWLDEVLFMPNSGPPVILAQPASQTVGLGDTATFAVGVGGGTPQSYQWFYDQDYAIAGATNVSLTRSNIHLSDVGSYHLVVSNASGSATSSNALLNVTTNGAVTSVLLFTDQGTSGPYRTALNNLGQAHQLFSDFVAFNTAVENADPATTLVVVDAPLINAPFNAVARFANKGGRAILQSWTLSIATVMAAPFNVSVTQVLLPSPLPVYDWGGSQFFAGLTSPLDFTDRFGFSGQKLQPVDGGQAVAGYTSATEANEGVVVVGHSGRTIFNAFMVEEITALSDAVRFAQNEIEYLLAVRTVYLSSPAWVSGQFQVMLTGTTGLTYSLRETSDFVTWATVTNVTLSASPMLITVPAPANWSFYQAVTPPVP